MREGKFQKELIDDIKKRFPGCEVLKNDSSYIQGICDLSIFFNDKYAMLEVKASKDAERQPNQEHYVNRFNKMSYAAFIYPENKEEILNELEQSFKS